MCYQFDAVKEFHLILVHYFTTDVDTEKYAVN